MKIYILLAAGLLSLQASAQTAPPAPARKVQSDTSRFIIGNTRVLFINGPDASRHEPDSMYKDLFDKKHASHRDSTKKHPKNTAYWDGIGIGFNGFLTPSGSLKMPKGYEYLDVRTSRVSTVTINLLEKAIPLYKNRLSLVTGLGFEWNNYFFRKSFTLLPGVDSVQGVYSNKVLDKNKLVVNFVNIPLLLEYKSGGRLHSPFHIAGGVILGYMYRSHTKQKYEDGYKYKDFDTFNLLPYRCSATVRAGYGGMTLFASYSLTGLFIDSTGPELHPFSIGISIGG